MSADFTDINMSKVKTIITEIVKPLNHICIVSFQTGVFPNQMKITKVIPVIKVGDKCVFTNYVYISLLLQLKQNLEKPYTARLDNFLNRYDLLCPSQYGFRSNRSTSHAILELVEEITNSLDNNTYFIGVFIDLKKAFDTVDHYVLTKKYNFYGVRGIARNKWIVSYLENMSQFVQYKNCDSEVVRVCCGVPQGSILAS